MGCSAARIALRLWANEGHAGRHISQIGGCERETNAKGFFDFYSDLLPRLHYIAG